tara:strand:- start:616 stop:1962 length:1347 start_codon:yes stop_codon:yes gene_type:complete
MKIYKTYYDNGQLKREEHIEEIDIKEIDEDHGAIYYNNFLLFGRDSDEHLVMAGIENIGFVREPDKSEVNERDHPWKDSNSISDSELDPVAGYNYKFIYVIKEWHENGKKKLVVKFNKKDFEDHSKHLPLYARVWLESGQLIFEKMEDVKNEFVRFIDRWWYENGQISRKNFYAYSEDEIRSYDKEWYENGQLKRLKEDGLYDKEWYENGQLKRLKEDGCYDKEWYENGQIKQRVEEDGFRRHWYENGQLKEQHHLPFSGKEYVYEEKIKGTLFSKQEWYENGQIKYEHDYFRENDGTFSNVIMERSWYDSGERRAERKLKKLPNKKPYNDYDDNFRLACYKEWYKNGQIKFKIWYVARVVNDFTNHHKKMTPSFTEATKWYDNGQIMNDVDGWWYNKNGQILNDSKEIMPFQDANLPSFYEMDFALDICSPEQHLFLSYQDYHKEDL